MKTNISGLMSLIKDLESNLDSLEMQISMHSQNKKIIELNKVENIVEDYKKDYEEEIKEYENTINRISYLKRILYEKNNNFKLNDGRSIQEAIVDNTNLRKLKNLYNNLLEKRNSKTRITEVNNSYFEEVIVNFDVNKIKKKKQELENKIYETDFEISKLNSIEFEINK